jgi:hypothetical protein
VITSKVYALLENEAGSLNNKGYASVFHADNHNNKETVFEVQFKKGGYGEGSDFPNTFAPFNSGTNVVQVGGTGGNNIPEMDMYNAYEDGDLRRDFSMALGYNDSRKDGKWVESRYVKKYFDIPYQNGDSNNNFPVIRYADVLLMYAEALNQNGKTAQACDYLNQVRRRGFGYQTTETSPVDIKTSDKNEFFLIVEHERRVELAFEGLRLFDLYRWKELDKAVANIENERTMYGLAYEARKFNGERDYVWPLPTAELDTNKKLVQHDLWK